MRMQAETQPPLRGVRGGCSAASLTTRQATCVARDRMSGIQHVATAKPACGPVCLSGWQTDCRPSTMTGSASVDVATGTRWWATCEPPQHCIAAVLWQPSQAHGPVALTSNLAPHCRQADMATNRRAEHNHYMCMSIYTAAAGGRDVPD